MITWVPYVNVSSNFNSIQRGYSYLQLYGNVHAHTQAYDSATILYMP